MENKAIPQISIENDALTISIPLDDLIFIIENRTDEIYQIENREKLLKAFKKQLENYATSNATELGITELQYLFDRVTDEIAINSDDVISMQDWKKI